MTTSTRFLNLLVFAAGLVTLGVELAGARLLDPWFGNSLIAVSYTHLTLPTSDLV